MHSPESDIVMLQSGVPTSPSLAVLSQGNFRTDAERISRLEIALTASEARYRTLFENAQVGILLADNQSYYLDANACASRMLGYTRDELIGLHASDIVLGENEEIQKAIAEINNRQDHHREWQFRRKDGSIFSADVIATQMPDGTMMGLLSDLSERRQVQEFRKQLAEIVESSSDAIIGKDLNGIVTSWNAGAESIFGYAADEMLGRSIKLLLPLDKIEEEQWIMNQLRMGQRVGLLETRRLAKDGRMLEIAMTAAPIRDALGRPIGGATINRDITSQKRAAEEKDRRQRAEVADRIKSAFLATMSHELRTPLNSIVGFTGILLQGLAGPLNQEQHKQLEMVRSSARHLLALVNDVLDISKIEAGQFEVAHRKFELRDSIENTVNSIRAQAEAKGLEVQARLAPQLGEASLDQRRFEQILLNLLSNAIKFTDRGKITLSAEIGQANAIHIRIADTGIGIRTDDLETLFQPFRQLDSGLARVHEGTGLGLAICRRLTEMMGGTIEVHSVYGQGSIFTVTLPLEAQQAQKVDEKR